MLAVGGGGKAGWPLHDVANKILYGVCQKKEGRVGGVYCAMVMQ